MQPLTDSSDMSTLRANRKRLDNRTGTGKLEEVKYERLSVDTGVGRHRLVRLAI